MLPVWVVSNKEQFTVYGLRKVMQILQNQLSMSPVLCHKQRGVLLFTA